MNSTRWYKCFVGCSTDSKLIYVAQSAGVSRAVATATMTQIFEHVAHHHPDTGSIAGLHLGSLAAWCEVTVEAIERVIAALREVGIIAGEVVANWLKRQGNAIARLAASASASTSASAPIRSSSADRMRRLRARRQGDRRQLSLLFSIERHRASHPVTSLASHRVTLSENINGSKAIAKSVTSVTPVTGDALDRHTPSRPAEKPRQPNNLAPPLESDSESDSKVLPASRRSAATRTSIKPDWQPSTQDQQFAIARGRSTAWVEREAEKFRNHHQAAGSRMADWSAAWRTWVLNAHNFEKAPRHNDRPVYDYDYDLPKRNRPWSPPSEELLRSCRG